MIMHSISILFLFSIQSASLIQRINFSQRKFSLFISGVRNVNRQGAGTIAHQMSSSSRLDDTVTSITHNATDFAGSEDIIKSIISPEYIPSSFTSSLTEEDALWFDEAVIFVRAGSGGPGANTFKFGKGRQHAVPNGGSGGIGGNVILKVDKSLNTLLGFRGRPTSTGENGDPGALEYANGLNGLDYIVPVPKGTVAIDNSTGIIIGELNSDTSSLIVAKGGMGGRGNAANKRVRGEKSKGSPPEGGQRRWIRLELKLVADIGLIGVPNAGKSTILNAITNARPKIASYPFTTLVPNLGVCEVSGTGSLGNGGNIMVIADIPGLIEGAHRGTGLGRRFLRHVERCKMIIHVINGDSDDPVYDYITINNELQLYSPVLAQKPQVVVVNKIDMPHVNNKLPMILKDLRAKMTHSRLLAASGASREGLAELVERSHQFLQKLNRDEEESSNQSNDDLDSMLLESLDD